MFGEQQLRRVDKALSRAGDIPEGSWICLSHRNLILAEGKRCSMFLQFLAHAQTFDRGVGRGARRKNRCSCAVDYGSSSRLSIFKMADDESKTNTSLSWLLAASCSLEALTNILAILVSHPCRCFDCDRKDRNGVFSFIR